MISSDFFQKLEISIEGLYDFISRFLRTIYFLIFHPKRIIELSTTEDQNNLYCRPIAFIVLILLVLSSVNRFISDSIANAFGAIGFALSVRSLSLPYDNIGVNIEKRPDSLMDAIRALPNLSLESIIRLVLPGIIIVIVSSISSNILKRTNNYNGKKLFSSFIYISGYQALICTIILTIFLILPESVWISEKQLLVPFIVLLCILLLCSLIESTLEIFYVLRSKLSFAKNYRVPNIFIVIAMSLLMSTVLLASANSIYLIEMIPSPTETHTPEHIWGIDSATISYASTESAQINIHLTLKSNREEPYRVIRSSAWLTIYEDLYERTKIAKMPLSIVSWSDVNDYVLEIRKGESKWIILQGNVMHQSIAPLESSEYSGIVVELSGFKDDEHFKIGTKWNSPVKMQKLLLQDLNLK